MYRVGRIFKSAFDSGFSLKKIAAVFIAVLEMFGSVILDLPVTPSGQELNLDGYRLVFCDEFDGDTLDTGVWFHRAEGPRRNGANSSSQVKLENGNMIMTSEYLEDGEYGAGWYSGMIALRQKYLRGYFEATMEAQRDLQGVNIIDRMLTPEILMELESYFELEKSEDSLSDLNLIFSVTTLGFKIAQKQRRRILIDLSKHYDVSIYTNSNTNDLIRVKNKGSVDYWSEMPLVFRNSKINLNMTIPNIKSGVPLRIYDILGAGGFCLTNFQAELPMQFENGKHMVWYYSNEDLYDKVDYYLKHEDERKRIAEAGREFVHENCSYKNRIVEMLDCINE